MVGRPWTDPVTSGFHHTLSYLSVPYSVQLCNGFSGNRRDGRAVDFDRRSRSDILFKGYIKLLKGTEGKGMRHALSVDRAP